MAGTSPAMTVIKFVRPRSGARWAGVGRNSRSSPSEHWLALLHEGAAAFVVVVAGETGLDHFCGAGDVALGFILDDFAHGIFHRLDGERRVGADHIGDGF